MASKGSALLRCRSMYRLKVDIGKCPYNTNNKKYNTTHEGTVNHYKDVFSSSDRLMSNSVEDKDAYELIMNAREIVNYRSRTFLEPDCLDIWYFFKNCVEEGTLVEELQNLERDNYVKCFQEEYAVVGIPIKRLQETVADFADAGLLGLISTERISFTKDVMHYEERTLTLLSDVFGQSG